MKKVLIIAGPTAVGKSSLSVDLAQKFSGEIISGDSMQVYRNLDIGTAKITPTEMKGINHYLIDIKNIQQQYSVVNFVSDAGDLIEKITNQGKLPIIAGGTGYYLQALIKGLALGGQKSSDDAIKKNLELELQKSGSQALWNRLNSIDPLSAAKIPVNNSRKVIRALEVYQVTGKLFSEQENFGDRYDALVIGLNCDRQLLYQRINSRVDEMMKQGLLEENQWLFNNGGMENPASKGIGYREFDSYFSGDSNLEEVVSQIKQDSRHYAKRQLTWFRNKLNVHWFNLVEHPAELKEINTLIEKWRNNDEL